MKSLIGSLDSPQNVAYDLGPGSHAKVLRKIDWRLLPLVSLLYLFSYLDRANIGNAKVAGMQKDLHLIGYRYNIAAAVLYITYCFGQIPSNIVLKLVRPSIWIPTIMVAWGLVMTLMCLVNTYQGLVVARVFLGLTEAGLFPGVVYYLSTWYPRVKRAKRIAIFYSAATLSGAFGGLLAYGIERMNGIGGLRGWQWIFCLEGVVTMLVAFAAFFLMDDYPETASFLTDTERRTLIELLKTDSQHLATHFSIRFVMQALNDYRNYLQFGIHLGVLVPAYAMSLFMPTIISDLGFSAASAQLLSVPPFAAGCISTVLVGIYSDKHQLRGPFIIGPAFVALVGYVVLYTQTHPGASYTGTVLVAMGVYPTVPVILAWASSNAGGETKRGVALAMVTGFANLGGICSAFIYNDPPRFHIGHGTNMGCLSFAIFLSSFAMWDYNRLNKQKEKECIESGITEDREEEFTDLGDESPLFRYAL